MAKQKKRAQQARSKVGRKRSDTKTRRRPLSGSHTKKLRGVRADRLAGLSVRASVRWLLSANLAAATTLYGTPSTVPGALWCREGSHWVGESAVTSYTSLSEGGGKRRPLCPDHATCILLRKR